MKYLNELINFIKSNDDWKVLLKKAPYNLKTIKECSWHPNWYMFVYNLFDSDLSNYVVRACRGTVLEINGKDVKVISYPYSKFDNYGSVSCKDIEDSINWHNAEIQSKIDGILIKTAKVDGKLYFFTNGSFDLNAPFEDSLVYDEVSTRGAETYGDLLLRALFKDRAFASINFNIDTGEFYIYGGWADSIPEGSTLMLELTSPRNKIICEYKETKLWWHGYRDAYMKEYDPRYLDLNVPFECPSLYNANNYDELKEILKNFKGNENEGVVVCDYTQTPVARCKVKCEDYLKLKFARDNACNEQMIFKTVVDGEYDDLVANIPACLPKVEEIKSNIKVLEEWYNSIQVNMDNRKDFVFYVKANNPKMFNFYMMKFDNKSFEFYLKRLAVKKNGYKELLSYKEIV